MIGLALKGGTGGDADDRSRRSPLVAQCDGGRIHLLWLLNILAEGIENSCARRAA